MLDIKIKYFDDIIPIEQIAIGDWIDLRSAETVYLKKFDYKLISLGVCMELPKGYHAIIAPRSSTFSKWGIIQANSIGIIDESFCGDNDLWGMLVIALRDTLINKNDRICQFTIVKKTEPIDFTRVARLGNNDRGGWGSTGRN